ncbi:phage holin family protein [Nocardioides sp.]|uniref:phage holin family protein n=1 Tax=Nocardioides sp. TaxID=35761 RepID=UPI001994FCB8|nr:phage holin family protein [Nocardioides sp.]MBC7275400.1 phage holin family protein [Nocardioides sp.]
MAVDIVKSPGDEDPTIGKLVVDATRDISELVNKEITLAKQELKISATNAGVGIGLFAAAAFLLVLAVIMLSVSAAYFIHLAGLGLHWAFLIVFAFYVLIAALLGFIGVRKVKKVKAPEKAIAQGKEIPRALKGQH